MLRILFIICFGFFLSGCDEGEQKTKDIAVLVNSVSNPYWKTIYDGINDTSKTIKRTVYVQALTRIGDAEEQLNQCENALLQKPKAVIFAAVNQVNLIPCLQKATKDGVILVDIDGNFSQEDAKKNNLNVVFSVASNNYELGKKAAEYIKDSSGKVLVIEGAAGSHPSIQRVRGFKDNIPQQLNIVALLNGDWNPEKAANITLDTLAKEPDISVIFTANDQMALGAVEALRSKNITNIKVIGVDGNSDAVKSIKDEKLTASIAQLPYLMAKQALEKTDKYLDAPTPIDFNQYVPIIALDKQVFHSQNEELLHYVR